MHIVCVAGGVVLHESRMLLICQILVKLQASRPAKIDYFGFLTSGPQASGHTTKAGLPEGACRFDQVCVFQASRKPLELA